MGFDSAFKGLRPSHMSSSHFRLRKKILSQWPTWCTNFNTFITILYMYMFRAISCSSSASQIVLIQHRCTGPSLTDSDDTRCCINTIWHSDDGRKHRPKRVQLTWNNNWIYIVHLDGYFHSCITMHGFMNINVYNFKWPSGAQVCTGRSLTDSDDTRCCINTIWPPDDEQDIARNMYM